MVVMVAGAVVTVCGAGFLGPFACVLGPLIVAVGYVWWFRQDDRAGRYDRWRRRR